LRDEKNRIVIASKHKIAEANAHQEERSCTDQAEMESLRNHIADLKRQIVGYEQTTTTLTEKKMKERVELTAMFERKLQNLNVSHVREIKLLQSLTNIFYTATSFTITPFASFSFTTFSFATISSPVFSNF